MLGVLHKCAHGNAHEDLLRLFPGDSVMQREGATTKSMTKRHSLQLLLRHHGDQRSQFHRSPFGLVTVWDVLPDRIVKKPQVSVFQASVTELVRAASKDNPEDWQWMLSPPIVSSVLLRYIK